MLARGHLAAGDGNVDVGPGVVVRWFRSLVSLLLWGVGWGVWFLVATTVLADYSVNPLLKPFLCLALLLFGYGVPRMVTT